MFSTFLFLFHLLQIKLSFGAITQYNVSNDQINTYYQYNVTQFYDFNQVFIDKDQNSSTGFQYRGIGAEYLVENNRLYYYSGNGATWSWTYIKTVSFSQLNGTQKWAVLRSDIQETNLCSEKSNLFFRSAKGSLEETSQIVQQTYSQDGCPNPTLKIAIPSYFYPNCNTSANCFWNTLNNAAPQVGLAVINPYNGPGTGFDSNYFYQTRSTQAKGIQVLGYVYTSYGKRDLNSVKKDIDQYYAWYGVDGIFLDEAYSGDCSKQFYYGEINMYVKSKSRGFTVINPGTLTQECYINTADLIINFEADANAYLKWYPMGWESKYPRSRFWHLIHSSNESQLPAIVQKARNTNAGWIYATPDTLPNPWDTLPNASYWKSELDLTR